MQKYFKMEVEHKQTYTPHSYLFTYQTLKNNSNKKRQTAGKRLANVWQNIGLKREAST